MIELGITINSIKVTFISNQTHVFFTSFQIDTIIARIALIFEEFQLQKLIYLNKKKVYRYLTNFLTSKPFYLYNQKHIKQIKTNADTIYS